MNVVKAYIVGDKAETRPLYRYDYGQILSIENLELPEVFEVHFSNSPNGSSTTQIGRDNQVDIPDMYLQSGNPVYAWIFLHTGQDDGETVYYIKIPVKNRASITDAEPTPVQQDVISQAISALNEAVEITGARAEQWENMSASANTLPSGSDASASYSNGVLSLGIPVGEKGEQGIQGIQGIQGEKGDRGEKGDSYTFTDDGDGNITMEVV